MEAGSLRVPGTSRCGGVQHDAQALWQRAAPVTVAVSQQESQPVKKPVKKQESQSQHERRTAVKIKTVKKQAAACEPVTLPPRQIAVDSPHHACSEGVARAILTGNKLLYF